MTSLKINVHEALIKTLIIVVLGSIGLMHWTVAEESASSKSEVENASSLVKQATAILKVIKEAKFKNIGLDFSMVETEIFDSDKSQKTNYWSSGKMFLLGEPDSLIKITYSPRTTTWIDGPSPYLQENQTIAYNGKYWLQLTDKSGPINSMEAIRTATISESCPPAWTAPRWDSGENFLVTHCSFLANLTLEKVLQNLIDAQPEVLIGYYSKICSIKEEGDLMRISIQRPPSQTQNKIAEMWIDLKKGGALKRFVSKKTDFADPAWFEKEVVVEDYAKVNGCWFPKKAILKFKNKERQLKLDFTASNFELFDESSNIYEVKLEPGTRVTDQRTKTSFIIGSDIPDTVRAIQSAIK